MSSPQRNHLKENSLQNSVEVYQSGVDLLERVYKENLENTGNNQQQTNQLPIEEKLKNTRIEVKQSIEEMLQQQTQQQTTTPFEIMKHCGLVDELNNMYDQYDGQQLDSSSASSKTEEMPISSSSPRMNSSPNPASPHSDLSTSTSVNNDLQQLNASHNSAGSGRASACSTNNNLNELNQSNQNAAVASAVNVNNLLNTAVTNVATNVVSSPTPAIAAQQINNLSNQNANTNNLLSELSVALMAAAGNLPNSTTNNNNPIINSTNQQTNLNSTNGNVNNLANLNGLNLLSTLNNQSPLNQIAALLAATNNTTNPAINQQQLLFAQAQQALQSKLPGFNLQGQTDLQEKLQQIQQQQIQQQQFQQLSQILLLEQQLNQQQQQQQQQSNVSSLSPLAPFLQNPNLQALLQNTNLLGIGTPNLLNTTPINQQQTNQPPQNRPGSASGNNQVQLNQASTNASSNLNLTQLIQQLHEEQVLKSGNNTSVNSLLNTSNFLSNLNLSNLTSSNLGSNVNQNVSNLLQHTLHNVNNNNNSSLKKDRGVDLSTLNNLTQHLQAKTQQQQQNSSSINGINQNTVAAALANLQQQNSLDCDSNANAVFSKLTSAANLKLNNVANNAFQNNTVANALLQQQQKNVLQLNQQSPQQNNTGNLVVNVQQQLRHLQQQTHQQPNIKQLSPQFENNSNHSNFSNSNSSSTNSKLANTSSTRHKLENSDATLNSVLNSNSLQGNQSEDVKELEELEQFAKYFKQRRIKAGYTQGDVGAAMGKNYGNDFSQTTISRFEALNLSFKNMLKLKPMLERWLHDTDMAGANGGSLNVQLTNGQSHNTMINNQTHLPNNCIPNHLISPNLESICKRRKKRTSIETQTRVNLERAFMLNQKPTFEEIAELAEKLNMEKEVVRVWFCNRRQKQRRSSDFPDGQTPYNCYDFNETGNQSSQLHRLANQFDLNRTNLNLRSPSPLSQGSQSDSEMNVDHSLPPSPVSSRKYSIRQDSFS